jgi:hypothetical protein
MDRARPGMRRSPHCRTSGLGFVVGTAAPHKADQAEHVIAVAFVRVKPALGLVGLAWGQVQIHNVPTLGIEPDELHAHAPSRNDDDQQSAPVNLLHDQLAMAVRPAREPAHQPVEQTAATFVKRDLEHAYSPKADGQPVE